MKKGSLILLILACIFATVALIFLSLETLVIGSAIDALFIKHGNLGDALAGIFLFLYGILAAIATVISSAVALPFDIILLKRNGKKWYSLAILIFLICAVVMAIGLVLTLPALSEAENAIKAANSSSSSSSNV